MMDGFAVRTEDLTPDGCRLRIVELVTAGETPSQPLAPGEATQIMTGAPVPAGCDAVVMVERTRVDEAGWVVIEGHPVRSGLNILPRATALKNGQTVLRSGHRIRAIEIGLMLEVGHTQVMAIRPPRVAVISTGNELVPASQHPALGQIRNSNGPMLEAQVRQAGGDVVSLGIGQDDPEALAVLIRRGLEEADVLVLSGGVSAGVMDLVPGTLAAVGVKQVFHKVKLKPGKPLWFGTFGDSLPKKLVFGLPGNPNSSLVCFELFVRPALSMLAGRSALGLVEERAQLVEAHQHRGDRPTYFPAVTSCEEGLQVVRPLAWKGSADQRTLTQANSLLYLAPGERDYQPGDQVMTLRLP